MTKQFTTLVQNQIKCKLCQDIIYSTQVHDYRSCTCGAVAVDGGLEYSKRTGQKEHWEEQSIYLDDITIDDIIDIVNWAKETKRNEFGIALAVVRVLRTNNYLKEYKDTEQ